jgi:DNA adenine methylase Dam
MEHKKVKTLFKYIGGKGWLKDSLRIEVSRLIKTNNLTTYVEPFTGGLGAFLGVYDILFEGGIKTIVLNDINAKLINFYKSVADSPQELIKEYSAIEKQFGKTIPIEAKSLHPIKDKDKLKQLLKEAESFFKTIRSKFNVEKSELKSSAQLLFLQKHCFNGVYRENSSGEYNTPFNWDAKEFPEEQIRQKVQDVNEVFKMFEVVFKIGSFENLEYKKNTLYYLDPPYINENITENKYNKDSFGVDKQKLLIEKISSVPFIYSNHENDLLIKEFSKYSQTISIKKIPRKNIISASSESRKTDKIEILVTSE